MTSHPTLDWVTQQARNLASNLGIRLQTLRFLLRDRDDKYSPTFDALCQAEEINIIKTAPLAPRMNARCERIIPTLRHELCDHVLILNETHAHRLLARYRRHYNIHRPHQARLMTGSILRTGKEGSVGSTKDVPRRAAGTGGSAVSGVRAALDVSALGPAAERALRGLAQLGPSG